MLIGERVDDRYEIIKPLGEGGMSTVYLAHDIILDRECVLKVLKKDLTEQYIAQFRKEVEAVLNLNDPNIIKVYDCSTEGDLVYIVYEYAEGDTLKDYILDKGKLDIVEAQTIAIQICQALIHSHKAGIIHRDIKPQNIIIRPDKTIKLMDFGIATSAYNSQPSTDGKAMGSVQYISPEQAKGEAVDVRTDIYSFGVLLFEMLTGSVPFKGADHMEITLKQINEKIPSAKAMVPEIPQPMENIIIRATAKKREYRYSSFKSLVADLITCLDEERANEDRLEYLNLGVDAVGTQHDLEQTRVIDIKNHVVPEVRKEEEKIKKNWWKRQSKGVKIGLITTIVAFIAFIGILFMMPKSYTMPDLQGMTKAEVTASIQETTNNQIILTEDNFEYVSSEEVAEGEVISTKPKANEKFQTVDEIKITISTGPEDNSIELQDYVGSKIDETKASLESKGFEIIVKEVDSEQPAGTIVTQYPKSGTKVDPTRDAITFEVSKGNMVNIEIPAGWTYTQVITYLDGLNMKYNVPTNKDDCAITVGNINMTYKVGDTVTINWNEDACVAPPTP